MSSAEGTRRRIIRAALRIIGGDGVAALTNRRIAAEAGVALGSVTYHFPSQHELLRESLRHFVTEETRWISELAERYPADRLDLAQAGKVIDEAASSTVFDSEHLAPFELYLQAGRDPQLRDAATESFAAYDRLATSILTALGVPDASRFAAATVALIMGRSLRKVATGADTVDLAEMLLMLANRAPEENTAGSC